jgi:hypothetical protein
MLDGTSLDEEICVGADRVEQILQTKIVSFAWPWGKLRNTSRAAQEVVERRFSAAFSTHAGVTGPETVDRYFLRRDTVDSDLSARELRGLLAGALDAVRTRSATA